MFAQKSPLIVAQNVINTGLGYAGLFFITRFISPQIFGFLAFAIGFGGIFSFIADMGFSSAHQKFLSEGEDVGECNGTYLVVKIVLGFLYAGIVFGALLVWTTVLHKGFQDPVEYWMIIAVIPYYFFQSLLKFAQAYYTAKLSPARMALPSLAEALLRNSIFIGLGTIFFLHLPASKTINAAILLSVTYSISYSLYFVLGILLGRPWEIKRPSMKVFRKYAILALPLAISGSLATINGNVDKVLIQFFWSATATGGFFLDQKIVQSVTALSTAVTVFFLPLLARINNPENAEEFSTSIREFERMTSLYILPFIVLFIVLNKFIINLFTGVFVTYSGILSVLAVTAYFQTTLSPYLSALTARGRTHVIAVVSGSTFALNIALNVLLVPREIFGISFLSLGVMGAAVSSLIATLINNLFFRYIVFKGEGARVSWGITKHLIPVGAQIGSVFLMLQLVQPYPIFILAPLAGISVLIYIGVAILIKEISWSQVWTFATYLNPLMILKQLKEER